MTPQQFIAVRDAQQAIIDKAEATIERAEAEASLACRPKNTRPASPSDIVVGAVLWFKESDPGDREWIIVQELRDPSWEWKGFVGDDGNSYGYDHCLVEIPA